jgi:hypothetical protein
MKNKDINNLQKEIRNLEQVLIEKHKEYNYEAQKEHIEFVTKNIGKCFKISEEDDSAGIYPKIFKIVFINLEEHPIQVDIEEIRVYMLEFASGTTYRTEICSAHDYLEVIYDILIDKNTEVFDVQGYENLKQKIMDLHML